ncbi:nucleoside-diphosphate-sugar epimerase [Azospirillum lipoferum]|uniref:NAD-dependent epimerase/dehydratase family protein n=1 Tax=Azospirillum lipoferum TaxID=193 RepID=A0A5A9GFN4_AZOLI|nr:MULTISPECIES: NAD-dependent epimerase/dehydratase family protein [Azospirillum]KAA0593183.1 NAD-dependent epimerase/dehydratase family protein [Azospirillum lipoferum]MCP1613589.1 nucleoside-diphosphate-sugar epimerase [Azospirillum lipoferum]MDW5532352.1 NAD-dependent epimerase/dehydratase family protein [Azospirillum sp. NL1]
MRILVTGAGGFVGRRLVAKLLADGALGAPVERIDLIDLHFDGLPEDARLRRHHGSFGDGETLEAALADAEGNGGGDVVFHLASLAGGAAEADYEAGRRVNLDATLALFDRLGRRSAPPVVVFASSIAVYGAPLPSPVDDRTLPRPVLSYGTHKLAAELVLQDLSRIGRLDGRGLRLPGIVARPRAAAGMRSAFMSELIWAAAAGEPYVCPVSPQAVAWWMSADCCVDNLLHAARLDRDALDAQRIWPLPVLRLTAAEVVEALARRFGAGCRDRIAYDPDAGLEAIFGSFPPLLATAAERLGFRHDGSADALIRNALAA